MNPATVASLASEFPNFILFKDTSGCDEVATSGVDLGGVFMVRGSEQGGYATWPRAANGPYDGFLLSTANVFAREIDSMMHLLDDGEEVSARAISDKLVRVVEQTFTLVGSLPEGNAFANANKVLDHCMAYGKQAARNPPPLLYGGFQLPAGMIERGMSILGESDLLPRHGYCCEL